MLKKFELLLMTPAQVEEFEENVEAKNFDIPEPLYKSWLQLKVATIPTEE
jgi:hypothetical protein